MLTAKETDSFVDAPDRQNEITLHMKRKGAPFLSRCARKKWGFLPVGLPNIHLKR